MESIVTDEKLRALALETLYDKRILKRSCFRTNEAGEELANCSPAAIPIIEDILRKIVVPALEQRLCQMTRSTAMTDYGNMGGLNYLFGAMLVIAVRNGVNQAFDFLLKLPHPLLHEAVRCASTFFWKTNNGYNFGVTPNKDLIDFLRRVESLEDTAVSTAAMKVRLELEKSLQPVVSATNSPACNSAHVTVSSSRGDAPTRDTTSRKEAEL